MKTCRIWTPHERLQLHQLKAAGLTRREIAARLGRTWRAVKHQLEAWRMTDEPRGKGVILTGVTANFCAAHRSPEGSLHGHSYRVTAWFRNEERRDARCFMAALKQALTVWDHKELPENMAWGEDIARAVGTLATCTEVLVERPLEGFAAIWKAEPTPPPKEPHHAN